MVNGTTAIELSAEIIRLSISLVDSHFSMYVVNDQQVGNIRILHISESTCVYGQKIPSRESLFGIMRLCRVMPNSDPEGQNFPSAQNTHV